MNEKNQNYFSYNLARLRTIKGSSQEKVAEKLGVSRQTVAKWEGGLSVPELDKAALLADFFDVTLDDLLRHDEAAIKRPVPPKNKYIFPIVKLGDNGTVVLPQDVLTLFQLIKGDMLLVLADTNAESGGIALVPVGLYPSAQALSDFQTEREAQK